MGITVLDRDHYVRLCMEHLGDSATYSPDLHNPTVKVVRKLRDLKSVWGPAFPETLWKYFFHEPPGGWKPVAFYILPKLHKKELVGRPIAASHSWVTSNVSRWLDAELRPWVLRQQTYLSDSLSLLLKLEETAFSKGIFLATYDVTSLHPSIPLRRGIDAVSSMLQSGRHLSYLPIIALLEWVMMNSYVEFDGQLFLQRQGTAMGTPAAVCFAVLFMSRLDEVLRRRWTGTEPLCHVRYIDDGLIVWPGSRDELEAYLNMFNQLDPNIKLTWHVSDSSADFLDMVIFKGPRFAEKGILDLRVFQKPMNRYLYLPFSSFHPRHCKIGYIKAELKRLAEKQQWVQRLRSHTKAYKEAPSPPPEAAGGEAGDDSGGADGEREGESGPGGLGGGVPPAPGQQGGPGGGNQRVVSPEEELKAMATEVRRYVHAVLAHLADNIPKAIVLTQVEKAKDAMLTRLYQKVRYHLFCYLLSIVRL
ncbi:unnamed protein product [Closterium sp. NIES-54]